MNTSQPALFADVTRLLRRHWGDIRHTGIDRVSLEYGRWVHGMNGGLCLQRFNKLRVLSRIAWGRFLLGSDQPGVSRSDRAKRGQVLLRACMPRRSVTCGSIVLVTTHSWLANDAAWRWLERRQCRTVVFVHDLIPMQFPEYSHPREKRLHTRRMRNTLRNAKGIIVNSRCTEKALREFARDERLVCPPVLVNPLGYELPAPEYSQVPAGLRPPYFVMLGTIEPRKNHLLILNLWRELARVSGEHTPQLVVIGRRGWECEQVVDMLERCDSIHPHMMELGNAPDGLVAALVAKARALLMPSFAEGFGMPVQESLALGTPVISTPLAAIKEFARDIPEYAEAHDGARWLKLIDEYSQESSPRRTAQLARMPRFRARAWREHFADTAEFLRSLN